MRIVFSIGNIADCIHFLNVLHELAFAISQTACLKMVFYNQNNAHKYSVGYNKELL